MQRTRTRFTGLLGPPLAALTALLLAGLLLALLLLARSASVQGAPAQQAAQAVNCYMWSFMNQTGQDADGLHLDATGIQTVSAVYAGDGNPFGAPATVGPAGGGLRLAFTAPPGFPVGPADPLQLGFCAPGALQGATFTLRNGNANLPAALQAPGLSWLWTSTSTLGLEVRNAGAVSLTLVAADVLDPGAGISVDELDPSLAAMLPLAAQVISEPVDLLPGASVAAAVSLAAGPEPPEVGKRYLVYVQWADIDDPNATYDFFALLPEASPRLLLPLISKQPGN